MKKTTGQEKVATGFCIKCVAKKYKFIPIFNKTGNKKCVDCCRFLPIKHFILSNRDKIDAAKCLRCRMLRKYDINSLLYKRLLNKQKGLCAVCKSKEQGRDHRSNKKIKLAVDHCHKTGKIRGLLCGNCNRGLGIFKDSREILQSAIIYLQKEVIWIQKINNRQDLL
jgi:hypothetical protein